MLTSEVICGEHALESIGSDWTALCDEGACTDPFLRPEWFSALATAFDIDLKIVTVRRDGRLRAVLPLAVGRSSVHGLSIRSLQGAYDLNTPRFDLIHGNDATERNEIVDAVWSAFDDLSGWDMFEARMTPRSSWLSKLSQNAHTDGRRSGTWEMDAAPFICLLTEDGRHVKADDFFKGPRKHFGRELDRRLRRLTEIGDVEFKVSREYSHESVQRYLDLETRGWKGRSGTAATQDPRAATLHHEFARRIAAKGMLRVYELSLNGEAIAMSLNIIDGPRVFHWKTTYDEAYAKFSPGNLLFRRLFMDSIADGLDEIDFLSPSSPNKLAWATGVREHSAVYVFRSSLMGWIGWAWKFGLIKTLRPLKDRLPILRPDVRNRVRAAGSFS